MFKSIKNWFRNPRPKCFTITIAIDKPNVVVSTDWADPENLTSKEIAEECDRAVKTIITLTNGSGPGLNEIQRAIGSNAILRKDQGMANAMMHAFRTQNHSPSPSISLDELIMTPDNIFPNVG